MWNAEDALRPASTVPYITFRDRARGRARINAISMAPGGEAAIDYEKCINCGACVYHCPFGATVDVSSIVSVIREIMAAEEKGEDEKVIAIVAPSIASQFLYASLGQVITGIKELGFDEVLEVAVGAEMVAYKEGLELKEKGFLTSSCCPAFVKYIETKHPTMVEPYISQLIADGRTCKACEEA